MSRKTQKRTVWWEISLSVALLVILVFPLVPAFAQDKGPNPNKAEPAQLTASASPEAAVPNKVKNAVLIPVGAFTNDGYDPDGYYKDFGGGYMNGKVGGNSCLVAPVIFPSGAKKINKVYVYAQDGNASAYESFTFDRIDPATGVVTSLGSVNTVDSAGITQYEIPISDATLSNSYVYQLTTCVYVDINVYGAKVTYKPAM